MFAAQFRNVEAEARLRPHARRAGLAPGAAAIVANSRVRAAPARRGAACRPSGSRRGRTASRPRYDGAGRAGCASGSGSSRGRPARAQRRPGRFKKGLDVLLDAVAPLDGRPRRGRRARRRRRHAAAAAGAARELGPGRARRTWSARSTRARPTEVYGDADVFALPSRDENFGVVAAEAAACGSAIVLSDRCGVAELLADSAARRSRSGSTPTAGRDREAARRTRRCATGSERPRARSPADDLGRRRRAAARALPARDRPVADLLVVAPDPRFGGGSQAHVQAFVDAAAALGREPEVVFVPHPTLRPEERLLAARPRRAAAPRSAARARSCRRCARRGRSGSPARSRCTAGPRSAPAARTPAGPARRSRTSGAAVRSACAVAPPRPRTSTRRPSAGSSGASSAAPRASTRRARRAATAVARAAGLPLGAGRDPAAPRRRRPLRAAPRRGVARAPRAAGARLRRPHRRPAQEPRARARRRCR